MRLPDSPEKYSRRWKYVEAAAYRYSQKRKKHGVLREMVGEFQPKIFEWDEIDAFRKRYDNSGIYTSVFFYDNRDLDKATRLGSLYFDLDSSDVAHAQKQAQILVDVFGELVPDDALRIYFTGKKGFHLEIEALSLGITGSKELPGVFRSIARDLEQSYDLDALDFQVYDVRRMWRLPNSIHQDTGLYKRELTREELGGTVNSIVELAKEPADVVVPEQVFAPGANEWYREYLYKFEEAKKPKLYNTEDVLERFKVHGTSTLRNGNAEKRFDPLTLFDSCPGIYKLWKKAEELHHLEHEERLFLCSILTYTDEAIGYLHSILANCDDYNFEKTQSHIDDWVRRREMDIGGRPFSCRRANDAGVGCGDCNLEPRKKWVKMGNNWIETDEEGLPSPIRYAYRIKRNS